MPDPHTTLTLRTKQPTHNNTMIEQHLIDLTEAIKANTAAINAILANSGPAPADTTPEAPAPAETKAKVKKESPAAPAPAPAPTPEPEAPAEKVVTHDELAAAIRLRLKEGESFKSQFSALRVEYNVASITELTDSNRGGFLARINAIETL